MMKKALLVGLMVMLALLATDSPAINVSKLYTGQQTWALEAFSALPAAPAVCEITAATAAGDYYICKESPGGSGYAVIFLSDKGGGRPPDTADRNMAREKPVKTVLEVMPP